MRGSNPYARSLPYRMAEWAACAGVHYTGIDRRLGPLHAPIAEAAAILMFHRVHPDHSGPAWRLERRHFRAHIEHLVHRYRVLPLDELIDALAGRRPLVPRAVAITFDDGYRDNFSQAFPVLEEFRCPATIFLTSGAIGGTHTMWWDTLQHALHTTSLSRAEVETLFTDKHHLPPPDFQAADAEALIEVLKRVPETEMRETVDSIAGDLGVDPRGNVADYMMTWDEAREMVESGLVTIGAHSVTHRNLKKLPLAEAEREILDSRAMIERELDRPVEFFAYPFGHPANDFTDEVKAVVREAGFRAAFTVVPGLVRPGDDVFALARFCESQERWQAPTGGFSRALFDTNLSGARDRMGTLRPRFGRRAAAGYVIRSYRPGDDLTLVDLARRAYAAFGGYVERDVNHWRWSILDRPGVDPEDILILTSGDGPPHGYGVLGPRGVVLELCLAPELAGKAREAAAGALAAALEERARDRGFETITFELPGLDRALADRLRAGGYRAEENASLQVILVDVAGAVRRLLEHRRARLPAGWTAAFLLELAPGHYREQDLTRLRVAVGEGIEVEAHPGPAAPGDTTIRSDLSTFTDLILRRATFDEARSAGTLAIAPPSAEADARILFDLLRLETTWYSPLADGR